MNDDFTTSEERASESDRDDRAQANQALADIATASGKRRINVIWETTQASIALLVSCTGMYTASVLAMRSDESESSKSMAITAFLLISNTVFLVIGFYFGRTNHTRVGGVGNVNREER